MLGNRASQHQFSKTPDVKTARSQFDRSFALKDTFDFDYLTPIFIDEILPGDTCNVKLNMFARLQTQLKPIMDNLWIDYFFFFVPNRLVWDNWEKFNGAQKNPGDSTDFIVPQVATGLSQSFANGTIYDKFGIPTNINQISVNALPFRAYNLIWNEWFRDQNLQNQVEVRTDNGQDDRTYYQLLKRAKKHDYFTSALPWPQKGPDVTMPIIGNAPIERIPNAPTSKLWFGYEDAPYVGAQVESFTDVDGAFLSASAYPLRDDGIMIDNSNGLRVAFDSSVAPTINSLREAFALQSLLELDARGGTRYVEILQNHWNVTSPDFRLQRPEYLGGGRTRINSHPVASTTEGTETPQATLAAFGTSSSSGQSIGFTKSFVEHGYVIGMACPRADITYQQGLNKLWTRQTRFDFFWPKLADLGEQAILNEEIYTQGSAAPGDPDKQVFGYQERWSEYRYKPSEIHGKFRSTDPQSLDVWHQAQEFGNLPALNSAFIQQSTPITRALAVTDEPHIMFDAFFDYKHARVMPVRAIPASLGRF